jgi:DNA-binding PadR family transcriptional regulator
MRRRAGTGLVRNESKILAAALRLAVTGTVQLYGYELFSQLIAWEGDAPMNHGTLYRCLRRLEQRGLFRTSTTDDPSQGPPRVFYELTQEGVDEARAATVRLASEAAPPAWVDIEVASHRIPRTT